MSINVTVHGNPISINRGKMVALDSNKEFELRRRIRIQQVRQQSKRIAEEVRNKVKREKNKQFQKFDNEGQHEFKDKQNKKITCLKQYYKGCLADFGRAFGDAENEPDPHELITKVNEKYRQQAESRGRTATQKLINDNEAQRKAGRKRHDDREYSRYIENVRSKLITDLSKRKKTKKKRKRKSVNIEINGEQQNIEVNNENSYDSDVFNNMSVLEETVESISPESLDEEYKPEESLNSQPNENIADNLNNYPENNEEDMNIGSKEIHISLPVCGKDSSKETVSYQSHKNYNTKNNKPSNTSDRLVAIADSLKKIAEEYIDDSVDPSTDAPCEKLTSIISSNLKQKLKDSEYNSNTKLKCSCDPRKSSCSICFSRKSEFSPDKIPLSTNASSRYRIYTTTPPQTALSDNLDVSTAAVKNTQIKEKWYKKFHTVQDTSLNFNDENDFEQYPARADHRLFSDDDIIGGPVRPVIMSQPGSPNKRKCIRTRQLSRSPTKPVRKTLLSDKNTLDIKNDTDIQNEYLQLVSPIKTNPRIRKRSPKKMARKKSSLHDKNYFLPTVPKIFNNMKSIANYELPTVKTTVIKEDTDTSRTVHSNVNYYDHFNKFSKGEQQPTLIQKISKDNIDIIPEEEPDIESQQVICQKRDHNAKVRGNKALEKVKIHQDYQKLLQELPILQRQERLANMPAHQPALHMSNERYQLYERKKQNAMENKFENMQSKAEQFDMPPVTLKSIRKSQPSSSVKIPLTTLDVSDENAVLNVGHWKKANSCICSEHQTSISGESNKDVCSESDITELLKRVNKQRELLLKEAVNMKSLGPLKNILNDEELINIICNCPPRQKVLVETGTSPLNKNIQTSESSKQQSSSSRSKSPKRSALSSSDTSVDTNKPASSKTKPKYKKLKVYLREEATQTSPLSSSKPTKSTSRSSKREGFTQTSSTSPTVSEKTKVRRPKSQKSQSSSKSLTISKNMCDESTTDKSDKVCEIIIRTGDQNVKISPVTCDAKSTVQSNKKSSPKKDVIIKIKEQKSEPQEKISLEMSTSTSYMSPPTEIKWRDKPGLIKSSVAETNRPTNKHLLQPLKQQTNLDNLVRVENGMKTINPRLVKYILRLLNMSRQSIEDLTISSVSDVSTPQESVIQSANNIAKEKLQTVMDHFHLNADDIRKFCLSSSTLSDTTAEFKQSEEKFLKQNEFVSAKQFSSTSTSTEQDEGVQVCFPGKKSDPIHSETEKYLGENREKDISTSLSSGYRGSKSKSPQRTLSTPRKDFSSICPDSISKSVGREMKDTSSQALPSTSNIILKLSSPKSSTVPSTTLSPKSTCAKVVIPKLDSTSEPYSTEGTTLPSSVQQTNLQMRSPKSSIKSPKKQAIPKHGATTDTTSSDDIMLKNPEKFLEFVRESLGMSVEEFTELGFEEMFTRHMELTEYCHDRIKSLMSLIEQIRNEKREICSSSSPIDKSLTLTSYLDLPPSNIKLVEEKDITDHDKEYRACVQNCLENDISSGSSISQEAIDKYLLGIGSDAELTERKHGRGEGHLKEEMKESRLSSGESKEQGNTEQTFVPMLQGIPKYTEANVADLKIPSFLGDLLQQVRPKPPPALLRSNIRGHTNEIPHELSTIAEVDTLISSRNTSMHRVRSPEERVAGRDITSRRVPISPKLEKKPPVEKKEKHISSDNSNSTNTSVAYVTISPEKISVSNDEAKDQQMGTAKLKSSCYTSSENGNKSGISGIQSLSETSQETTDELESLLKKFKLEWAISLVKKTEQALALSSSSSSSDVRGKRDISSDVSVKENFRQLCKKLASLNESDIERAQIVSDLTHHFRELHDVSEIPGVADSKNKSHQRTSTPVLHSKSTESKKSITNESLFKVDSELSSVKNTSDENYDQLFLSIPNITLNTEHISLRKS